MNHYPIRIDFRGQRMTAQVHAHDGFFLVWFTDTEIIRDFGGQVEISSDLKTMRGHKPGIDQKDFHNAILEGLKNV